MKKLIKKLFGIHCAHIWGTRALVHRLTDVQIAIIEVRTYYYLPSVRTIRDIKGALFKAIYECGGETGILLGILTECEECRIVIFDDVFSRLQDKPYVNSGQL